MRSGLFRVQHAKEGASAKLNRIGFAFTLGAMGLSAANQTVTILLLRFLTDSVAISAATATLIIGITHFYDAAIDPAMGHASDRTSTRWGRRRPYLVLGALLIPLSLIGLFNVPAWLTSSAMVAYVMVLSLLLATGCSMFKVPYTALSIEACSSYHERSRLMAFRVYGGSFGLMLGSTLPAWSLAQLGSNRAAYGQMAWLIGGVAALCCLAGALMTPKERHRVETPPSYTFREYVRIAWDNRPFRIACSAHAVFMIGVATVAASNAYFTRYVLEASDAWLGTFYIIMVTASLVSVPGWLKATLRLDKKRTYSLALALYGLSHLSWMWADAAEPIEVRCLRVLLIGVALGGVMLLAYSITADVIHYDSIRSGHRREGALCGIQSIIDRAFSVIGVGTLGLLLTMFGYLASDDTVTSVQPDSAIAGIYIAFSILPAACCLISIWILSKYDLTAEMLQEDRS
jgi:GPH family glycoside/pentoside/hexuronide:cation symporter